MGWNWPRGYFYRCPLPSQPPAPSNPSACQGGCEGDTTVTRGEDTLPAPPVLPRDPPAPSIPPAAGVDGELGHSPAQAAAGTQGTGRVRGDKATAQDPQDRVL